MTTNTHGWQRLFGDVRGGVVCLSAAGAHVTESWARIPTWYPHVTLDAFVVMPDHIHGVLALDATGPRPRFGRPPHGLPEIVRALKTSAAIAIDRDRATSGVRVRHRGFHDRLVRDARHLDAVRRYVVLNPSRWKG